jgi:hypothetical protein
MKILRLFLRIGHERAVCAGSVRLASRTALLFAAALPAPLLAGGTQTLDPVEVTATGLVGAADSATEGTVTQKQIATRPWLRPAEVLETVPGLIVTQHTGDGKANQYFLRGFNLDHGTDFATFALGVPVNLPTHAHGQGYTDLNFLIPELIGSVRYRKGPYSVQQGDFASAGSASIDYVRMLPAAFAELGAGADGFRRAVAGVSPKWGEGHLLLAGEVYRNDGPWEVPQGYRKDNAVLRYATGDVRDGWDVSLLAYDARWNATDQVAQRAIDTGLIGRYGSLDPSSGGSTSRTALSAQWARPDDAGGWRASAYAVRYRLDLFSNFTYFASDPINGDQFEQSDRRTLLGGTLERRFSGSVLDRPAEFALGAVLRQDDIDRVGLHLTRARERLSTIREDAVLQRSAALTAEASVAWTRWLRTVVGLRADRMQVNVTSDAEANSGSRGESIVTPKFTAVLTPSDRAEVYASLGHGFHSNDARGATIRVNPDPRDPGFGERVDPVPLLVRTRGEELGLRLVPLAGWQSSVALWRLRMGSELVFVGDAGTTEASRPSRRSGIELANYWRAAPGSALAGLTADLDISLSQGRFTDSAPEGNRIPGAIERTAALGLAYDNGGAYFGGLRMRYFGPRALVEDNSERSSASTLVNARFGWRPHRRVEVSLDLLNLFDRRVADIEYYYESQLRGEAAPVADRHLHPAEPRSLRLALRVTL